VSFNANGGSVSPTSKVVECKSTYGTLPTPSRTGNYSFDGWYTAASGGSKVTAATTVTTTSNHTLYAHWTPGQNTLFLYNNYSGKNYFYDSDFNSSLSEFCWTTRDSSVATLEIDRSQTYGGYNSLKVTNASAGSSGKDLIFRTKTQGNTGEGFVGDNRSMILSFWAKSSQSGTKMYIRWGYESEYRNVTLSTSWQKYTVSMDKTADFNDCMHPYFDRAGTVWLCQLQLEDGTSATEFVPETSGSYTGATGQYGGNFTLPDDPTRSGYTFDGWYLEASGKTKLNTKVEGSICAFARWTAAKYTVTLNPSEGSVSPTSITVTYGGVYGNLPTPTRKGYTCAGCWYTAASGGTQVTPSTEVTTAGNHTLYAHWTLDNVPVEGVSLNKTALTLTAGASETLSATITPDNATNKAVTWTTSDASVATVSDGTVTAIGAGTATITVTTADGNKTAACAVTVSPAGGDIPASNTPLKLVSSYNKSTKTATVSLVTAETIVLSNYDVSLTWDNAVFTLSDMANGQPSYFSNFQKNKSTGMISAASGGDNVTVAANETLATYTLTTANVLASGDYQFSLSVKDASNEEGTPLEWKGKSVNGALTVSVLSADSFDCRASAYYTLDYTAPAAGDFTITAELPCIVLYSDGTGYRKLAATPIDGSTYSYILPDDCDASAKIVIAVKADFNGDGEISSTDALQVLRCAAGNRTYDAADVLICDINGDGELTSTDTLQILRIAVGLRALSW